MRLIASILLLLAWPATAAAQTVGSPRVSESAGVVRVPITLPEPRSDPIDVSWRTGNPIRLQDAPGARPDVDYVPAAGTLTFAAGETAKEVMITLLGDTVDESGAYFSVFAGDSEGFVAIEDDDPTPAPSIEDASVDEDSGQVTLTVTRPAVTERGPMRYLWRVLGGTAALDRDVAPVAGELGFATTDTAKTLTVPIVDDDTAETDETFRVEIAPLPPTSPWHGAPAEPPADAFATVTIVDDDPLVLSRSGSVLVGPGIAPLVDVRRGVAEYGGAQLSGAMFRVRSETLIALAGRCGRTLAVSARPGLRVRGHRATTEAASARARWTLSDGCRRTTVRVSSGRVKVTVAGRVRTLRRGQSVSVPAVTGAAAAR